MLFDAFDAGDDADEREQAEHEEDFAGSDARGARITACGTGCGAFVEFERAPDDEEEGPPVDEKLAKFESAIVVEQQQDADDDENQAAENAAPARATVSHRVTVLGPDTGFDTGSVLGRGLLVAAEAELAAEVRD
jgi:hypothetical protein